MREEHLVTSNAKFLSVKTHIYMEEEIDMNIIDMVQVNTKSCNCSLVLHLLIAGAEEGQGTITVI
jgi:hypothetical protein